MKFTQKFRHYWHDTFYSLATKKGVHFAMKCRDVTGIMDLEDVPSTLRGQFRFWLHISLCQACKNYLVISKELKKALQTRARFTQTKMDEDRLNESLLQKHAKK